MEVTTLLGWYTDLNGDKYIMFDNSKIESYANRSYATKGGFNLVEIITGFSYEIDGHAVSQETYSKMLSRVLNYKKYKQEKEKYMINNYYDYLYSNWNIGDVLKNVGRIEDIISKDSSIGFTTNKLNYPWGERKNTAINNKNKGDFNMPKIKDYKYIKNNGVTIVEWSDGTITKVIHDPATADQFTGFVTAIAKKAMGNRGKMLSEWERLVIKPVEDAKKKAEKERLEAEKKAEEERIHAEARAKRKAKKEEREKAKDIDFIAKEILDDYKSNTLWEEAKKVAIEKYGVPQSYFDCETNTVNSTLESK